MSQTFFEMLGNWSFGDYFKKEAIAMSWELLTKVYGLDPDRLYVTYFEGNPDMSLDEDLEAKDLWLSVGVPDDHILPGNMKDNFWEMGDQGPCGPCSEIHYDKIGGGRNAAHLVNMDDPMVVEVWNNVFIQFDRQKDKSLKSLPAKHVDTGMGFERLVSALQDTTSNYATDVFTPLFARIRDVSGARPYTDKYGADDVDGIDTAYRVVADHIRTLTFSIADGAVPNNDGRGYVIRRVLRRGVRYARKYFNVEIGSFFSSVLPALVDQMGGQFPEIVKKQQDIKEILDEEELAFARTLDRGEAQFEKFAADVVRKGETRLSGDVVWRLYDTFGFPVDLTKLMAEEKKLDIDDDEVKVAQEKAREASKSVKEAVQTFSKLNVHQIAELERLGVARPDDGAKFARGDVKAKVQLIYDGEGFVKSSRDVPREKPLGLLLDRTNFYAESGGQVADTGRIVIDGVAEFKVLDVQSHGGYVVHNGHVEYGELSAGDDVLCEYDELRRQPIRNNHTGTHVLNHSLREVLGDDVHQKGSLVDSEKLRFDFSHKTGLTGPELSKIEDLSNAYIRQNCKIYAKDVELDLAQQIEGVRAVFGETYPKPGARRVGRHRRRPAAREPQEPRVAQGQRRVLRRHPRRPDGPDQGPGGGGGERHRQGHPPHRRLHGRRRPRRPARRRRPLVPPRPAGAAVVRARQGARGQGRPGGARPGHHLHRHQGRAQGPLRQDRPPRHHGAEEAPEGRVQDGPRRRARPLRRRRRRPLLRRPPAHLGQHQGHPGRHEPLQDQGQGEDRLPVRRQPGRGRRRPRRLRWHGKRPSILPFFSASPPSRLSTFPLSILSLLPSPPVSQPRLLSSHVPF